MIKITGHAHSSFVFCPQPETRLQWIENQYQPLSTVFNQSEISVDLRLTGEAEKLQLGKPTKIKVVTALTQDYTVTISQSWQQKIGNQRDWVWRGHQTRYTYLRSSASKTGNNSPPLIFLHGFGASIGHWRHNLSVFSQTHTVYALDMLGFGGSEKVSVNYTASLWAEQVHDFWQTFIQQPVILVGNSIGSLVCLTAAVNYPEIVQGLVMLNLPDASVLEPPPWAKPAIASLKFCLRPLFTVTKTLLTSPFIFVPFFQMIRHPRMIKQWAQKAYVNPTIVNDELVEIFSQPAYDRGAAAALCAMINAKSSSHTLTAKVLLPQLDIPMLLIWGRQDMMVPPKLAPLFVEQNPNLKLIEIDQAGHCPHDECPEQVNQAIINWIKSWDLAVRDRSLLV